MSDYFPLLLIVLAIPMIYSSVFFVLERRGNSSNKSYLRFIFLFPIFYILFFVLYYLFNYCIDFIAPILDKYDITENIIILEFIFLFSIIGLYIFLMKKYLSFNDINLFLSIKVILSFLIIYIMIESDYFFKEEYQYASLFYFIFFIPLCWILFFINIEVQYRKSEKRKKQSDANPQQIDGKKEKW